MTTSGSTEREQPPGFVTKFGPVIDDVPLGTGCDPGLPLKNQRKVEIMSEQNQPVDPGDPHHRIGPDETPPAPHDPRVSSAPGHEPAETPETPLPDQEPPSEPAHPEQPAEGGDESEDGGTVHSG